MNKRDLSEIVNNLDNHIVNVFKKLHSNPELSNEEYETTRYIKELLEEVDVEIIDSGLKTGVIAEIGSKEGPIVALRCDIDALPINEETELEYKSNNKEKMHACGHDFHISTVLGVAYLLKYHEEELKGRVRLLFQPAEETGHGAEEVIRAKALDNVDAIFGLHNNSNLPVGTIGTNIGPLTAAVDRFEIIVNGIGSHAADPDRSIDPVVVSSYLVTALQTIISRNISPYDKALISVTKISSGNTWNVIPMMANLEGTVRTLNSDTRKFIENRMREISEGVGKSFGATIDFQWYPGPPATDNDLQWTIFAIDIANKLGYVVEKIGPWLGGEDFAYYQELVKGTFINVGTGISYPHHHPKFQVDDGALRPAIDYFNVLVKSALNEID